VTAALHTAAMIAPSPPSAFLELQAAYAPDCPRGQVLRQHRAALCGVVAEPPRSHSPKLGFALLRPAGNAGAASADEGEAAEATEVQVVMNVKFAGEDDGGRYAEAWRSLGCGDLVLVEGHPGKTRTGTRAEGFSLFACSFAIQRMAPDVDRALRLLLKLPNAAPASGSGSGDLRGTAAAEAAVAAGVAEPSAAEHELRRLLSSMLHEEHPTAPVLQLLQSLAAPRLERRRRDDRLAVEGAATAAAAAAEAAEEAAELYASLELPSDDTSASNTQGALGEARMQRIRTVASRRQRGLIVVLEELDQPANVGAALRTCDGFGVATVCHVAASSTTAGPLPADGGDGGAANGAAAAPAHFDAADPVVQACSKSASVWLSHRCFESTAACAAWLREQGKSHSHAVQTQAQLQHVAAFARACIYQDWLRVEQQLPSLLLLNGVEIKCCAGVPSVATTPPHDELLEWSGMQQQQQEEVTPNHPIQIASCCFTVTGSGLQ
jgi:hypothetical protein